MSGWKRTDVAVFLGAMVVAAGVVYAHSKGWWRSSPQAETQRFTPADAPPLQQGQPPDDRRKFTVKRNYYHPGAPIFTLELVQKDGKNDAYTLTIAPELREKLTVRQLALAAEQTCEAAGFRETFAWTEFRDIPASIPIPEGSRSDENIRLQKLTVTKNQKGDVVIVVHWSAQHPASKYGSFTARRTALGDGLHRLMKYLQIPFNMAPFDWDCPEGAIDLCYID